MKLLRLLIVLLVVTHGAQVLAGEMPRPAKILPLATQVVFLDIEVNGSTLTAVGERGVIARSLDQGKSWQQIPSPVDVTLTAINFASDTTAWVVGHESTILKTTDGGENWQVVRYKPEEERFYLNVIFNNEQEGVVLGTDGELWSTSDGGDSWSLQVLAVEEWFQNHLFDYHQLTDGSAVIAAERGGVFARLAGESNWQVIESPYPGTFFGITQLSGKFLLYGMSGKAYLLELAKFAEDKHRWQEIKTNTDQFFLAGRSLTEQRSILVGRGGVIVEVHADGYLVQQKQRDDRIDLTAILNVGNKIFLSGMKGGIESFDIEQLFLSDRN